MKKALLAAILALGIVDAAQASQFATLWYEGQYYCKFTNAGGYFNVRFSSKVVERPRTCNGNLCSTNGYELKKFASMYLNLWKSPETADRLIDQGSTVQFYKQFQEGRLHVRLGKPSGAGQPVRGIYTSGTGKVYGLICTKG